MNWFTRIIELITEWLREKRMAHKDDVVHSRQEERTKRAELRQQARESRREERRRRREERRERRNRR